MGNNHTITATVCVFSGRRNPQWTITAAAYHQLLLAVEALPATAPQEQEGLLGYSGIIITGGEKKIFAFNGAITVTSESGAKGYADKTHTVENSLLHTCPPATLEEIKGLLPGWLKSHQQ